MIEAAKEAEADPQTPRTPTTEDLEYDLAGTPNQYSDYQGSPSLAGPSYAARQLGRNSSIGSQVHTNLLPMPFDSAWHCDMYECEYLGMLVRNTGAVEGICPESYCGLYHILKLIMMTSVHE